MKRVLPGLLCALALVAAQASGARGAEDPCLKQNETPVALKTSDGADVYGVEVGAGTTGVVLGHQFFSDHCELMGFARELAQRGYRVLAIDFRGYGDSAGGVNGRLDRDVAAAVARLRADGATRIKLVGASMGGTAVLAAGVVDLTPCGRRPEPLRAGDLSQPRRAAGGAALAGTCAVRRGTLRPPVRERRPQADEGGSCQGQAPARGGRSRPRVVAAGPSAPQGAGPGVSGALGPAAANRLSDGRSCCMSRDALGGRLKRAPGWAPEHDPGASSPQFREPCCTPESPRRRELQGRQPLPCASVLSHGEGLCPTFKQLDCGRERGTGPRRGPQSP